MKFRMMRGVKEPSFGQKSCQVHVTMQSVLNFEASANFLTIYIKIMILPILEMAF